MMDASKILIFAGTTEGRELFACLCRAGADVHVSVATEYGKSLFHGSEKRIFCGRMDAADIESLLEKNGYTLVVDATHPYAAQVTQNIKAACAAKETAYLRLLRPAGDYEDVILCGSVTQAADYLKEHEGNVLCTIGSKELAELTALSGYASRVFARILSVPESIEKALALGFSGKNLICMQGPFSCELNAAMLRQYDCSYLLTKNSGGAGGFEEKLEAAQRAGAKVILIDRPVQEEGCSYEEILALFSEQFPLQKPQDPPKTHFPLFTELSGKTVLVAGAGTIAQRRIKTLLQFSCIIRVVAPQLPDGFLQDERICFVARRALPADLDGAALAVAATDDRAANRMIGLEAQKRGIPVSVADCREECTFFFPAVVTSKDTVIGIAGDGNDHKAVANTAKKIREALND